MSMPKSPVGTVRIWRIRGKPRAYVCLPDHPNAQADGWIPRARLAASEKLGRPLVPGERVQHIDGDRLNDDPANLAVGRAPYWTERVRWRNGRRRVFVFLPSGWQPRARVVAARLRGRPLAPGEAVWHCGGNVRDDSPANLRIIKRDVGAASGADQGDPDHPAAC